LLHHAISDVALVPGALSLTRERFHLAILKAACTFTDLGDSENINAEHISEAINYLNLNSYNTFSRINFWFGIKSAGHMISFNLNKTVIPGRLIM
jgi:hypothetical protein